MQPQELQVLKGCDVKHLTHNLNRLGVFYGYTVGVGGIKEYEEDCLKNKILGPDSLLAHVWFYAVNFAVVSRRTGFEIPFLFKMVLEVRILAVEAIIARY